MLISRISGCKGTLFLRIGKEYPHDFEGVMRSFYRFAVI